MNKCVCKDGFYPSEADKNKCLPCNEDCLTCTSKDVCTKCKGLHKKVDEDGKCVCVHGFEESGGINCKTIKKPNVTVGEVDENEECIVIKKHKTSAEIEKSDLVDSSGEVTTLA